MELAALLNEAQSATPDRRIEWRDRIASHGARGIEGVRPWLADGVLAAFAVRVIERAGIQGEPELATAVLRSARARVPASVTDDVSWALKRVRASARPVAPTATPAPSAPSSARPVQREAPRFTTVARRRPRAAH